MASHQSLMPVALCLMVLAFLLLSKKQLVENGYLSDSDHQEADKPPSIAPLPKPRAAGIGTGVAETDVFGPFERSS